MGTAFIRFGNIDTIRQPEKSGLELSVQIWTLCSKRISNKCLKRCFSLSLEGKKNMKNHDKNQLERVLRQMSDFGIMAKLHAQELSDRILFEAQKDATITVNFEKGLVDFPQKRICASDLQVVNSTLSKSDLLTYLAEIKERYNI